MKNIIDFLGRLKRNNYREWFESNKSDYLRAREKFLEVTEKLIDGISVFDPSVKGVAPKDCTFRIYRDARFAKGKEPYHTYMGAYICPQGKKSGYAGYYFHIEPKGGENAGGNFITAGIYQPDSDALKSIREDIMDRPEEFLAAVEKAKAFSLFTDEKLKRCPNGFSPDDPMAEYLKLKHLYLDCSVSDSFLCRKDAVEQMVARFETTREFVEFLNRAARYAFEER